MNNTIEKIKDKRFLISMKPKSVIWSDKMGFPFLTVVPDSISEKFHYVPCRIEMFEFGKVFVKPEHSYQELFPSKSYYITDFTQLIKEGLFIVLEDDEDYKLENYRIPIMSSPDGFPLIIEEGYHVNIFKKKEMK